MNLETEKIGVLLMNLGTPDSPNASDVKTYLREFLSDRRIVDLPAWKWKPILHGIILNTRPAKSGEKYKMIWTDKGSPLLLHGQALCQKVQETLNTQAAGEYVVKLAMRYGNPSTDAALKSFIDSKIEKIIVIPLYPQYSSTTTASALDAIYLWGLRHHYIPEFRFINDYHDCKGYIAALSERIKKHWQEHGKGEKLVMSFHGVPQKLIDEGDPYQAHCNTTGRLVAQELGLNVDEYLVTYQSKFGNDPWLLPATQPTLEKIAQEGTQSVDVICPGFAADCLETLEEIDMECREAFIEHGGKTFQYIPCLNSDSLWVETLSNLVQQHCNGWKVL